MVEPTPEMIRQKTAKNAGFRKIDEHGNVTIEFDSNASTEALDVLLTKGEIDDRQHRAGALYRLLRESIFGPMSQRSANWPQMVHEHLDADGWRQGQEQDPRESEDRHASRERKFEAGNRALDRPDLRWLEAKRVVRDVCLDGLIPKQIRLQSLRFGLDALADCWRIA